MMRRTLTRERDKPRCIVVAGPNGAGKTTFAREYLPKEARILNFVNADLIASGLSPLRPERAAVPAARLMLDKLDRFVERRADFAWESTLSGLAHIKRLQTMKELGYRLEIIYLRLASPQLAVRRIAARVRQGGHNVPKGDVLRRFFRSWHNFETRYRPLADAWAAYDNSGRSQKLMESNSNRHPRPAARVERALLRASETARRTARRYGTPIYVRENGKVIAKRP
jgi:predicted ABC-type ATPase